MDTVTLFVDSDQLVAAARTNLGEAVEIKPYDSFFQYLQGLSKKLELNSEAVRYYSPAQ